MSLKKCVVVDLDNTLWGGIVGEDGLENLALSLSPPGNSFIAFQQALLDMYDRGILLAINSRNNPEDALKVIREHPNMILKEKNFAAMRINWNDKADNIRELAQELNIGLDSMVFLDDDPINRGLVRATLPEVEVPELPPEPSEYVSFFNSLSYFPSEAITDEDKMRGNLYVTERLRRAQEKQYTNKEEYLSSLGLSLTIYENDLAASIRLSQMSGKTNQFNIDKRMYSEDELKSLMTDPYVDVIHGKLSDKFGDYGIVIMAIVEKDADRWHIPTLLMSCRAFGRRAEYALLSHIAVRARAAGANRLSIAFRATDKNVPAKEFVDSVFMGRELPVAKVPEAPKWLRMRT